MGRVAKWTLWVVLVAGTACVEESGTVKADDASDGAAADALDDVSEPSDAADADSDVLVDGDGPADTDGSGDGGEDVDVDTEIADAGLSPAALAEMSADEVATVDCAALDAVLDEYVGAASACVQGEDVCRAVYVESGCDCARGLVVTERFVVTADAVRERAAECGIDGESPSRVLGWCSADAAPVDSEVSCDGTRCQIRWPVSCWSAVDAGQG